MIKAFVSRLRQGYRTSAYPRKEVSLPPRFRGRPVVEAGAGSPDVRGIGFGLEAAEAACPTGAFNAGQASGKKPALDMGLCIFCGACTGRAGQEVLHFTGDFRLSASRREDLVIRAGDETPVPSRDVALMLEKKMRPPPG